MTGRERGLAFLLRLSGSITLTAFLAVAMPASWMAAIHARLGFGSFPDTPVMAYLARTIAALYGLHGVFVWIVASDVRRYRVFAAYVGWATLAFGAAALWIDFAVGMPLWWTLGEGPVLLLEGMLMLWLLRAVPRNPSALLLLALLPLASGCSDSIARIEDERRADSAELVRALGRGSTGERVRAALAMGRIQSAAYAAPLAAAAAGGERAVRLQALFALGQLGLAQEIDHPPAEALAACKAAAVSPDAEIAAAAVECLGKQGTPEAAEAVLAYANHGSTLVRAAAAHALFRCRFVPLWRGEVETPPELPDAVVAAQARLLGDAEVEVRRLAAHALSRYGEPRAVRALSERVGDSDEWVRMFVVRALGRSKDSSAIGALVHSLEDRSAKVRTEAVAALAALSAADSIPALRAEDPDFHARVALARALGVATGAASLATLRHLAEDASPSVRATAVGSLAGRLGAAYDARIAELLGDADWRMRVAAASATGTRPDAARRALGDADSRVRVAALEALPVDGGSEAILAALDDPDLAVRGSAVAALEKLTLDGKLERIERAYRDSPGAEWIEVRQALVEATAGLEAESFLREVAASDPAPAVRALARRERTKRGVDPGPAEPAPPAVRSPWVDRKIEEDPIVLFETSKGSIRIRALAQEAPIHVASFVDRVQKGFYDGLSWHRVVSNFVVQGGDPRGDGWGSTPDTLRDEVGMRPFLRGSVGMPKSGKDTGSCQIFFTLVPTPHLDGNYTLFGLVEEGMEVVDRLEIGDTIVRGRVAS